MIQANIASNPEQLYDRLQLPADTIRQTGYLAVVSHLRPDLAQAKASFKHVAHELLIEHTGQPTDVYQTLPIATKIVSLIRQFPWLTPPTTHIDVRPGYFDSQDLDSWIGNHEFDDYPGLYGISEGQGHDLRGEVNGRTRLGVLTDLCAQFEIPLSTRHEQLSPDVMA